MQRETELSGHPGPTLPILHNIMDVDIVAIAAMRVALDNHELPLDSDMLACAMLNYYRR